jgi:hypothetical protein
VAPFPMFALVLFIRRQNIFGAFADTRFMDLAAIPRHRRHRGLEHLPLLHTSGSPYPACSAAEQWLLVWRGRQYFAKRPSLIEELCSA